MSRSKSLFTLGLLMLNVGCLTAHTPMRREFSVKADGNIQAESQSRSLIEELASMLPEEEAQQAQSLLMLAKEGAPKDELTKMVSDLKKPIPPWRIDAQATLQKSIDAVHECATTMKGAVAQWPEEKSTCDVQSDSHTSCREEESKKFQNMMHWKGQRAEKKEIMDTECKIFDDVKKEVRAAKASYSNGDEESYLESVCNDFGALQPRYEDAKKKCTTAKADHARVSELYEKAESAYTAQKQVCDEKQTQTEVSYCQYALTTKGTCNSYGTCYEDKVAEYMSVKEIVESEEKLKKVEWRVYSRIECLLPVLGTDKADEIENCRKKTYSLEDVAYPDIPGKDACTIDAAYPGTNAYYTAHMAPLPDDAKGGPVAQCVGLSAVAAPYCVEIVTGTAGHNDGTLDVHIDAGNGLELAATGMHAKGSNVVHECFVTPVSALQVRNPTNNAWTGAMKYSTDSGTTYRSMTCASGCQAGQSTDGIVVDGNTDGAGQAGTRCLSGATCTITQG